MSFEILSPSPIPLFNPKSAYCKRIVEIAGRLAAVDDRYQEWASAVGVETGTVTDRAERDRLIAELDALVALAYGLAGEQIEHVFATFHRGWDYSERLAAVLEHYDTWKVA